MLDTEQKLLATVRKLIQELKTGLPEKIDAATVSPVAKVPYKVLSYRNALAWRTEEIARSACDLLERNDIGAGVILARATAENAAAIYYLKQLVHRNTPRISDEDLDNRVMQLLLGSRSNEDMPKALQVLTMLDKADKAFRGMRSTYDQLSEYAHPNWSGVSYIFSRIDHDEFATYFGKNARGVHGPLLLGLDCLQNSLEIFEEMYEEITGLMPSFIQACEAELDS